MPIKIKKMQPMPLMRVYFSRAILAKTTENVERGGKVKNPVLESALEIPGVERAQVTPYSLAIMRAPMFAWNEIEPRVMALLEALNIGEGSLMAEEVKSSKGEQMQPNDIESADLGSGYTLSFQKSTKDGSVRAVVKNPEGAIFITGPVVPAEKAFQSRIAVLTDPKNTAWLDPSASGDADEEMIDEPDEDEDEDDEEEEDED